MKATNTFELMDGLQIFDEKTTDYYVNTEIEQLWKMKWLKRRTQRVRGLPKCQMSVHHLTLHVFTSLV